MAIRQKNTLKKPVFWAIYAGVIALCIIIDQLTKHFIEKAVAENGGEIKIIGDWLTLVWTTNDGATGGIFKGMEGRNILFFVMTLVGLPVFGWMLWRSRTRSVWGQVAFSFVIGGTIGNAIDRLFLAENGFFTGAVRDFVQVKHFFGIFNMADSFLVVGVILALLAIVFFDPDSLLAALKEEREKKRAATTIGDTVKDTAEQTAEMENDKVIDDGFSEESTAERNDENL